MNTLIALVALLSPQKPAAHLLNYIISSQGMAIGTGTADFEVTKTGAFQEIHLDISAQGQTAHLDQTYTYDEKGAPTKQTMHATQAGQGVTETATFSKKGAHIVGIVDGKKQSRDVALPAGKKLGDPSVFWFSKTKPKKGAKVSVCSFDIQIGDFLDETDTYVGDESVTAGGKKVTAHHLTAVRQGHNVEIYVDDKGQMVKYDDGQTQIERKW